MELRTFVQGKDELDTEKAKEFIESCLDAKLVLIHCSVRDDKISERFFKELINELDTPFLGVKVDGTATRKGFSQNVFTYAVLCGDFEVEVHSEEINYDNLDETADNIADKLNGWELCISYSTTSLFEGVKLDYILRRVQERNPNTQIAGGVSAPKPIVATKKGLAENEIIFALIKELETEFYIDSGFQLDENSNLEFQITKADELHIYKINHKPAVDEYCRIQHIRPYMLNKIMELNLRKDTLGLTKKILKLNKTLYDAMIKAAFSLWATKQENNLTEILAVCKLVKEGDKNYMIPFTNTPQNTIFKRAITSKEEQLEVYNHLIEKNPKAKATLVTSCYVSQLWFNFDYNTLVEKTKKIPYPHMISFFYGEYGTQIPYKNKETNVLNAGTIKALVFK